jgi:uncharacterized protein (TIGR00730 family)
MQPVPRPRYQTGDPAVDTAIQQLTNLFVQKFGHPEGGEHARQMLVTAGRLLRDGAETGEMKLLNNAMKELRHAFGVFRPFRGVPKVAVFGSARTRPEEAAWKAAHAFAERLTAAGWMVITGAGDGIMGAAQGGAGRERSFGVNIRLPFEQQANSVIAEDHKLVNFRYFFTRKVIFVKEAHAIALFPGGYGTFDEAFEALTLVQTGKAQLMPIVLVDRPGGDYWRSVDRHVREHLERGGMIGPHDVDLYRLTDDVDVAVDEILGFYRNYRSSRYVRERLVIRLRRAPTAEELDRLNADFADIVREGSIEVSSALPEERNELEAPRVVFTFDRRATGRLRQLVDALNALVPYVPRTPPQVPPPEVPAAPMSPAAKQEEEAPEQP